MKDCRVCGERKPLTDYYRHDGARDGRRGECMICTRSAARARYVADPSVARRAAKRWKDRNLHKHNAHGKVSKALRSGKLTRQPCEACGDPKAEAHHDDYSRPLDVRWRCRIHHMELHRNA